MQLNIEKNNSAENFQLSCVLCNNRVVVFDLIRIFAALAVVMIHSNSLYLNDTLSKTDFIFTHILSSLSRIGVPFFAMLSGSLLLNENKVISAKKTAENIFSILISLIFWSFIYSATYNIVFPIMGNQPVSFGDFLHCFFYGHYHLWYLFMIIGFYLICPILKKFVCKKNKKTVLYLILLSVVFQYIFPAINFFLNFITSKKDILSSYTDSFMISFIVKFITYFLLGWYIANIEIKKNHRIIIYVIGAINLILRIITVIFSYSNQTAYNISVELNKNINLNLLLYTFATFVLFFYALKDKKFYKVSKTFASLSNLTFGVYLIHPFVLDIVSKLNLTPLPLQVTLNFILTSIFSFAICFIISKIPLIKKTIKG